MAEITQEKIYTELCTSYRAIDDFRQKLLSILPLASGGILAFLIDPKFLSGDGSAIFGSLLPAIGALGFLVTLGLFFYEIYGIRRCTYLIFVGAYIESKSDVQHGQFRDRPPAVLGFIAEPMAAGIVYPAVMAAWSYLAMYFLDNCSASRAVPVAAGIFFSFVAFMVWYVVRLKKEWKCWRDTAGIEEPDTTCCAEDPSFSTTTPQQARTTDTAK
jgi:hypothetical protein